MDYAYGKVEADKPVCAVLVAVDCESRMLTAFPVEPEGVNLRAQAEQMAGFSLTLNHVDKVEFVGDTEPVMKALLPNIQLIRQHLGFQTQVFHSKPGDKGRTAQVERAVQALRRQASTLLHMVEQRCEFRLPADLHPCSVDSQQVCFTSCAWHESF